MVSLRGYLPTVRAFLSCVVIGLAAVGMAQKPNGVYRPKGGQPVTWSINDAKTLVWGGTPYLPVGVRVDGTVDQIQAAKEAGLGDVVVELPAGGTGWDEALKALESQKLRYLIDISSLAPMAKGFAIEPQAYSISGITQARRVDATIPGATSVLAILTTKRDNNVEKLQRIKLENGRLSIEVKPLNDLEHILLLYPEMRSLEQPDLWESLDEHRDTLLTSLKNHAPGAGLRGIINPLGRMLFVAKTSTRFVPSNPYFRYEFRTFLEKKYQNMDTAQRNWALASNDLKSFDEMARLLPLWAGKKGISLLWDPVTDKTYTCTQTRSKIWDDIQAVIAAAGARRYQRITSSIREQVDVPVIQEWSGWASAYEGDTVSVDGVGARVSGASPTQIIESASRAASTVYRWKKPGWLVATDIDISGVDQLGATVDDLSSLGARGWFFRNSSGDLRKALAPVALARSNDSNLANYGSQAVFYPENAANPAATQRLASGAWWLPSPLDGNRVDLGTQFYGYRVSNGSGSYFVIWSTGAERRIKLRVAKEKAKALTFATTGQSDPQPKFVRGGVEVTIGELPLMIYGTDDIPVPEPAYQETIARFGYLAKLAEEKRMEIYEEKFHFADALTGFDANPGGNFYSMREWFWKLSSRFAPYVWQEAEFSKINNFSEPLSQMGCSNAWCLALRSTLESFAQTYYADYSFQTRSTDLLEVWVAAKLPPQAKQYVTLSVGGQTLSIEGEGLSQYGSGFAWYKMGTTKLVPGISKIRLTVDAPQGTDLAIDTILLIPGNFRPNGVYMPDAVDFSTIKPKN